MLLEGTKQPLAVAITHLTTLIFYHFVEKSIRNDLQLFIDFFFFLQPSTPWTGIGYNINCIALRPLHALRSGILTWDLWVGFRRFMQNFVGMCIFLRRGSSVFNRFSKAAYMT